MINCTKHSLERYAERFKDTKYDGSQKELYVAELNKMFEHSTKIYTGAFNDNQVTNFRLVDDIILVTDTLDTKIITLYRVEFGFGREVDKTIRNNLLESLDELETIYIKAMDESEENKDKLFADRNLLKEEIKTMRETLDTMTNSLKGLDAYIKTIGFEEEKAKCNRDLVAKKIVYSNIYRKALEEYSK